MTMPEWIVGRESQNLSANNRLLANTLAKFASEYVEGKMTTDELMRFILVEVTHWEEYSEEI